MPSGHLCTLAVPKFILPNFGKFLRRHLASSVKMQIFILLTAGKGSPGRVRVGFALVISTEPLLTHIEHNTE